MTTDRF